MKKDNTAIKTIFWRFIPVIVCFIWVIDYFVISYILKTPSQQITHLPVNIVVTIILSIALISSVIFFPYQFYVHAAFCWLWGLYRFSYSGTTIALLMHLLGYVFLYRQGFFNSKKILKTSIGVLVLILAIAVQSRFGYFYMLQLSLRLIDFSLIILACYFVLKPEFSAIKKQKLEMLLRLPQSKFNLKDSEILTKILAGQKYEVIAREENETLVTFKRHIHRLFNALKVNDRITFLSLYANHKIILENDMETSQV